MLFQILVFAGILLVIFYFHWGPLYQDRQREIMEKLSNTIDHQNSRLQDFLVTQETIQQLHQHQLINAPFATQQLMVKQLLARPSDLIDISLFEFRNNQATPIIVEQTKLAWAQMLPPLAPIDFSKIEKRLHQENAFYEFSAIQQEESPARIILSFVYYQTFQQYLTVYRYDITSLLAISVEDDKWQFFFTNYQGEILSSKNVNSLNFSPLIAKTIKAKETQLTTAITFNQQEYLLAYRKDHLAQIIFFNLVKKNAITSFVIPLFTGSIKLALLIFAILHFLAFLFSRNLLWPLKQMIDRSSNIANGDYSLVPTFSYIPNEISLLTANYNQMITVIKDKLKAMDEYRQGLENKIQLRTADLAETNAFIKAMINSLSQGLLVFDRSQKIHRLNTKSCEALFARPVTNQSFLDLINDPDYQNTQNAIEMIFSNQLPFLDLAPLLPSFANLPNKNKKLHLDYFPMLDAQGIMIYIVVVITDQTREYAHQLAFEIEQTKVQMVIAILGDRQGYQQLQTDFDHFIQQTWHDIAANENLRQQRYRQAHTFKGRFLFFAIRAMGEQLHQLENLLLTNSPAPLGPALEQLASCYQQHQQFVHNTLGAWWAENANTIPIPLPTFQQILAQLQKVNLPFARSLQQTVDSIDLAVFYHNSAQFLARLAQEHHKQLLPVMIQTDHILLAKTRFRPFLDSLIHLWRNLIDHGIESPDERLTQSKPSEGFIQLKSSYTTNGDIILTISDDGQGINPQTIRQRLAELAAPAEILAESDEQIIYHIFDANFSTRTEQELNLTSGRGVGMAVIAEEIAKINGVITLHSKVGTGSTFIFRIQQSDI